MRSLCKATIPEMKLVAAFVLLILGTLVSAQLPRCQSPRRWRANILRIEPTRRLEIRGRIAYDAELERFRILEDETSPVEPEDYYGRYYYFQERVYYSVNLKTRQCYRKPLYNETFRPIGVPFDAKPGGTGVIGTSALEGAGVAVDSWYGTSDEGGNYLETFTNVGCIPVSDQYYSQTDNFFASTFFYDVAEGFNPDDFVLPTFCFE